MQKGKRTMGLHGSGPRRASGASVRYPMRCDGVGLQVIRSENEGLGIFLTLGIPGVHIKRKKEREKESRDIQGKYLVLVGRRVMIGSALLVQYAWTIVECSAVGWKWSTSER